MTNLVTVIIPVHNSEKYVSKCLESILNQTYRNIEVIVILDHCTDQSELKCIETARGDGRVRILTAVERGVVHARNLGIKEAAGEYLTFVDSDDWLDEDTVEFFLKGIGQTDLLCTGFQKEFEGFKDDTLYCNGIPEGTYVGKERMEYVWKNMMYMAGTDVQGIHSYIWGKLFRRNLVLKFYNQIDSSIHSGEDAVFVYWYLLLCESVKVIKDSRYHYYVRSDSTFHSIDKFYLQNINALYIQMEKVFRGHELEEELTGQLENRVCLMVNDALSYKLGFRQKHIFRYGIPFLNRVKGKKIILYGAGRVGNDYYRQLKDSDCEVVAWLDKRYRDLGMEEVVGDSGMLAHLEASAYDYIVVAIREGKAAESIIRELKGQDIAPQKIIWEEPIGKGRIDA